MGNGGAFDKALVEVGRYEASMWGAYLTEYKMLDDSPTNPTIRYYAVEHGEKFYFDLKFLEVGEIWSELRKNESEVRR